ncbi:hypothetical protein ABK040_013214 [Willaertia magna]
MYVIIKVPFKRPKEKNKVEHSPFMMFSSGMEEEQTVDIEMILKQHNITNEGFLSLIENKFQFSWVNASQYFKISSHQAYSLREYYFFIRDTIQQQQLKIQQEKNAMELMKLSSFIKEDHFDEPEEEEENLQHHEPSTPSALSAQQELKGIISNSVTKSKLLEAFRKLNEEGLLPPTPTVKLFTNPSTLTTSTEPLMVIESTLTSVDLSESTSSSQASVVDLESLMRAASASSFLSNSSTGSPLLL